MNRKISRIAEPKEAVDGSVRLNHVLSRDTMYDADPLLLLDAFDSTDPSQYEKGFPMHPHRGIETISYVYEGSMVHKDSLGNEDAITGGEVQWMTAGSGILHEEQMPPTERLFGVQLWLNLAKKDKWVTPQYQAIRKEDIKNIGFEGGFLKLLAGTYKGHQGFISKNQPVDYYDVHINPGQTFEMNLEEDDSLTLFSLIGQVEVQGQVLKNFHAGMTGQGDKLVLENKTQEEIAVLVFRSRKINEPIAWTPGPIVMNTQEELDQAYKEIEDGTFIQEEITMND